MRIFYVAAVMAVSIGCGNSSTPNAGSAENFCKQLSRLPCGETSEAACRSDLSEMQSKAADLDCSPEFDAFLNCLSHGPLACDQDNDVQIPSQCEEVGNAYKSCESKAEPLHACSSIPTTPSDEQPCMTDCEGAAAACAPASDGGFECACTEGSHIGSTFSLQACEEIYDFVESCR